MTHDSFKKLRKGHDLDELARRFVKVILGWISLQECTPC